MTPAVCPEQAPHPGLEPPARASVRAPAPLLRRTLAFAIDASLVMLLTLGVPGVGGLVGAAYLLFRDGLDLDLMRHRSFGKHAMGLHLRCAHDDTLDVAVSVRRNWTLTPWPLAAAMWFVPILNWVLVPLLLVLGSTIAAAELLALLTDGNRRRLGDRLAGTIVTRE